MLFELGADLPYYPALFGACVLAGMFWPWPEDVPLVYAGMCVGADRAAWLPTLAVTGVALLVRDLLAYGSGRLLGELLLDQPWVVRLVGRKRLARARGLVERNGTHAVIAGRFLVGLRAPVFLVAGAMGVPLRRFIAWDGLGLLIVVPATLALGAWFGEPLLEGALDVWSRTRWAAPAVIVTVLAVLAFRSYRRRRLHPA